MNQVHSPLYFSKIVFNITLPSIPASSKWSARYTPSSSHFPLLYDSNNSRNCVTFRTLFFSVKRLHLPPVPSLRTTVWLSATAYSKYSQIPSIFGVRLLLPQTEDAACRGDRDPQNMALISGLCFSSHVGYRYIMRHIFKPVWHGKMIKSLWNPL